MYLVFEYLERERVGVGSIVRVRALIALHHTDDYPDYPDNPDNPDKLTLMMTTG